MDKIVRFNILGRVTTSWTYSKTATEKQTTIQPRIHTRDKTSQPNKINSFVAESQNVTNISLIGEKTKFKARTLKLKNVAKMFINVLYLINFPVKVHSFGVESEKYNK